MKNVNVALVRLLQFVVFVLFTFMVLIYFGSMVLLPLDAAVLLIKLFTAIGLNGFIAALIAIAAVAFLGLRAYKIPGLSTMIIDTGVELVNTGKAKINAFNGLAESVKV